MVWIALWKAAWGACVRVEALEGRKPVPVRCFGQFDVSYRLVLQGNIF